MSLRSGKNLAEPTDGENGKERKKESKQKSDEDPPWAELLQNMKLMVLNLKRIEERMELLWRSHEKLQTQVKTQEEELKITKQKLLATTARLERYQNKNIDLEARSRCNNIRIVGLEEGTEKGDLTAYFGKLFYTLFATILSQSPTIQRAHRSFTSKSNKPRSVLVCFDQFKIKDQIIREARKQKVFQFEKSKLRFYEDYPKEIMEQRSKFALAMKQAYEIKLFPSLRYPTKVKIFPPKGPAKIFYDPKEALEFLQTMPAVGFE